MGAKNILKQIPEQYQAELALKKSQQQLLSIYNNTVVHIFTLDRKGIIRSLNHPTPGLRLEEVIGSSIFDFQPNKEEARKARKALKEVFTKKQSATYETYITHPDLPEDIYYYNSISPLIAEGKVVLATCIAQDITKQKLAEQKLKEKEERYHSIFNHAFNGIVLICLKTLKLVEFNDEACKKLGYDREEFSRLSLLDIEYKQTRKALDVCFKEVSKKKNMVFETKFVTKKGEIRDFQVSSSYLELSGKEYCIKIMHDITEEKKREQEIKDNEQRMKAILNGMPDLIFRIDKEGNYLDYYTNNAADLVVQPEDFMYKNIMDVIPDVPPEKLASTILKKVRKVLRSNSNETFEYTLEMNGASHTSEARIVKIADEEVLIIVRNITEQIKAKEQLLDYQGKLSELAQNIEKTREEEKRNIALEIHDVLGQELTAIKMGLFMVQRQLKDTQISEEQQALAMSKIQRLIEQTAHTMEDARRISYKLRPTIIDDLGLIPAIEWILTSFEQDHKIKTSFKLNISEHQISFDPDFSITIYRILQEALTNVLRHAKASKVSVKFIKQHKNIQLEIKDNGIGINLNRIKARRSIGMMGMGERIKGWEGTMEILNDGGTILVFNFPIALIETKQSSGII